MTCLTAALTGLLLLATHAEATCPRIHRSTTLLREFRRTHPCPATGTISKSCKNYVIDHMIPMCLAGQAGDVMDNLTWQDVESAKRKDRLEKKLCRQQPRPCAHQGD